MVKYKELISILNKISFFLQVKGEQSFKAQAYITAADIIEMQNPDLETLAKENRLMEINGFGKALSEKIGDYILNGKMSYYENLINEIPESLWELKELDGLGIGRIKRLYDELGVTDKESLKVACLSNKVSSLKGIGKSLEDKLLEQIK